MQVERFSRLPQPVQREIEDRLAANGFSDYISIAQGLRSRGYRISKSSLHRFGQKLKSRVEVARAEQLARRGASRKVR